MTLPNILTFSRLPAMFAIVALMNSEFHWAATIAFWLFFAAALTDWLDGKLARESGQVTTFGRFMDAVIDKVMVLGIMIAFVGGDGYFMGYKITATMLLLCILGREFMISGLRMVAATKGVVVEADMSGKIKTFLQLNAIGWMLGARMLEEDFGELFRGEEHWQVTAVHGLGLVLFVLSTVLTITSGAAYFHRHRHVLLD